MTPRALTFQGLIHEGRPGVRAAVIGISLLLHAGMISMVSRPSPARPPQSLPAAVEVAFVKLRPIHPVAAPPRRLPKPVALKTSRGPRALRAAVSAPPPPLPAPSSPNPERLVGPAPPRGPMVLSQFTVRAVSGGVAGGTGTTAGESVHGPDIGTRGGPGGDGSEEISQPPVVLNAGSVDIKKYYPPAALKDGFEGAVSLKLVIEADGTVAGATVTHDPGAGLGEAALRAIREFRFSAGRLNGERVRAVFPFVVRFVINL